MLRRKIGVEVVVVIVGGGGVSVHSILGEWRKCRSLHPHVFFVEIEVLLTSSPGLFGILNGDPKRMILGAIPWFNALGGKNGRGIGDKIPEHELCFLFGAHGTQTVQYKFVCGGYAIIRGGEIEVDSFSGVGKGAFGAWGF